MPPKTVKKSLADALEDLTAEDFKKFVHRLVDRREEPRVPTRKVENKSFLEVTDVLVSHFTEAGAVAVAVEILRSIGCNEGADALVKETGGQSSTAASCHTSGASAGAAGGRTMAEGKHFVDQHQLELIRRVSNIAPILDELLVKDVIQQETYDQIRVISTCQEKMRALYSGPLRASVKCKDIFYEILQTQERYLITDLNKGQ